MEPQKRKVGQDFVIKKKVTSEPVLKKRVLSAESKNELNKKVIVKNTPKQVTKSGPESNITKRQEQILKQLESRHSIERKNTPTKGGVLWYVVGILCIGLFFTISSVVGTVRTVITLEETSQEINEIIPLYHEPKDGQLGYSTATVIEQYEHIPTTETQESVSEKATGSIKVINKSATVITIPRQTVVMSSTGKQFITEEEKKVPAGTEISPTSVDIDIVAENSGEEFNVGFDDFSFPNFNTLTARTVEEVTGGFIGSRPVITDPDRILAENIVRAKFAPSEPGRYLMNQVPTDFILPQNLVTVSDIEILQEIVNGKIQFIGKRTIEGVLLKKQEVFEQLDYTFIIDPENTQINQEKTKLDFTVSGIPESSDFSVTVSGELVVEYTLDESVAKSQFVGKKVKEIAEQGRSLPGIIDISTKVTPPWLFTVPAKQSRFTLEVRHLVK